MIRSVYLLNTETDSKVLGDVDTHHLVALYFNLKFVHFSVGEGVGGGATASVGLDVGGEVG